MNWRLRGWLGWVPFIVVGLILLIFWTVTGWLVWHYFF